LNLNQAPDIDSFVFYFIINFETSRYSNISGQAGNKREFLFSFIEKTDALLKYGVPLSLCQQT
jgi:hypothetical protein